MRHQRYFLLAIILFFLSATLFGQVTIRKPSYIPYTEAQPILEALGDILPADLQGKSSDAIKSAWATWVARRDADIRRRLLQGDEDTLVNLLLFGTSFTKQPRITGAQVITLAREAVESGVGTSPAAPAAGQPKPEDILNARINDLTKGLTVPGTNERLLFARQLIVAQKRYAPESAAGREQIKKYLLASVERVLREQAGYAKALEAAHLLGNPSEEFYERSKLYRNRGLALDTSLFPSYAIEEALKAMKARGALKEGSVHHIAIIGPGLDFTDKQEGYDFYPQQCIQPFAVIDSLLRLGLSPPGDLRVETLDLSPRVNDHLTRARQLAQRGSEYVVQLPRNLQVNWQPDAIRYWEHFGDQIGVPGTPVAIPADIRDVKVRAVRIKPSVVSKVSPVDLNIVLQRLELAPAGRFDLIIATNILVYYDAFEQSLAMANIKEMLQPGGFLLCNNALPEFPFLPLHAVGFVTLAYTDRPNDGEHMVWYQYKPE